jgi:hypothetical protein
LGIGWLLIGWYGIEKLQQYESHFVTNDDIWLDEFVSWDCKIWISVSGALSEEPRDLDWFWSSEKFSRFDELDILSHREVCLGADFWVFSFWELVERSFKSTKAISSVEGDCVWPFVVFFNMKELIHEIVSMTFITHNPKYSH